MKKILAIFLTGMIALCALGAQEAEIAVDAGSESVGIEVSGVTLRVGGYGKFEPTVGAFREVTKGNAGAGALFEVGVPVAALPEWIEEFGVAVNAGFDVGILNTEMLSSIWDLKLGAGLYARFIILPWFVIQPQIGLGGTFSFPSKADGVLGDLKKVYADLSCDIAVGLRFVPQAVGGRLEIELCPTYSINPLKGTVAHNIGGRVGVLWRIK